MYRLDYRRWGERVVAGPGDRGRFVKGLVNRRDGISSCDAVTSRAGVGVGEDMDWVRDTDVKEAEPLSGSVEGTGVVGGDVTSVVNHMRWYRLRVRVARRMWIVCFYVCRDRTIFHTMCGVLITRIERSM